MSYRMDSLESLSDEELRVRLVQYGFQNLPVTSTTRKVLIKKLRNHMDAEKQKIRRETSYATRYSSGEESDTGNERRTGTGRSSSKKNVRATVAASVASAASAAAAAAAASMPPPPSTRPFKRVTTSSAYNSAISSTNGGSSGNSSAKPAIASSNANKSISPGRSSVYISPVYGNDSEEEDYAALRVSSRSYSNSTPAHSSLFRKNAFTGPAVGGSYPSSGANANSSGGNANHSGTSLNDSNNSNGSTSSADTPYISEYTKRLLQFRGETVSHENYNNAIGSALSNKNHQPSSQHHLHPNLNANHIRQRYTFGSGGGSSSSNNFSSRLSPPMQPSGRYTTVNASGNGSSSGYTGTGTASHEFNENDIVTHAQPAPEPPQIPIRVALSNLITKLDEHYGFKQTFIPCALLCLFVTFLVFVAFMYLTISTDIASTLSSIDTRYDLCESERAGQRTLAERCVMQADVEPALELLKLIGPELKERVERNKCVDTSVSFLMSADEVLQYAKEQNPALQTRHLHAMEYLIERNPQWRIEHCDADGTRIGFDQVLQQRSTKTNHFAILEPKLPFTCMLYNKFRTFFVIVGGLGLVAIVAYFVNYFFKFVLYVKQKRKDQVNAMISDIIQAVSQATAVASESADPSQDGRVVISHLRDRILTPENRRRLDWAWTEALLFLEHNESRIQFEVGSVGGEDFKMMRWIDTAPLPSASGLPLFGGPGPSVLPSSVPPRGGGGAKKWQSPAFDKSNKIHDPPTPCLKVRQMFDKYEVNDPNLKTIVQDAILEKVGSRCRIYDIQLDRNTCCVYVRCASAKDAGIVHDEINGWWFDNRLVSIKFLRLERFQARFPRSLAGPACLKPSNKNNASMTHQLIRFGKLLNRNAAGGSDDGEDDTEPTGPDPDQDDNDDDDDDEDEEDEGDRLESDDQHQQNHQRHRHLHHQ